MGPPLQNTFKTADSSLEDGGVRDTRGSGGSGEREHVHPYRNAYGRTGWGIQCWACLRISPLRSGSPCKVKVPISCTEYPVEVVFFTRNVRRIWCLSFSLLFIFELVFHHVSRKTLHQSWYMLLTPNGR